MRVAILDDERYVSNRFQETITMMDDDEFRYAAVPPRYQEIERMLRDILKTADDPMIDSGICRVLYWLTQCEPDSENDENVI